MLRFIKRLLGDSAAADQHLRSRDSELIVQHSSRSSGRGASDRYFETMSRMQTAFAKLDLEEVAQLVRENLGYIPDWVKETLREYGSFDIRTIPALQQGGTMLALVGDDEALDLMQEIVAS